MADGKFDQAGQVGKSELLHNSAAVGINCIRREG